MKTCQGGAGRRIECLLAPLALVSPQTPCLATRYSARCATMRALAIFTHACFNGSQRSRGIRGPHKEHCFGLLPLRRAEVVYPREPFLKLIVIHANLSP